jgi:hypothetical protein
MEITGPDRLRVSSSITVAAGGLQKLQCDVLSRECAGPKLVGCKATAIGTLLGKVRPSLGQGVSGVFVASDGATTDPISFGDLVTGWIVHSDPTGAALPPSLGGPLRVVYPEGSRVTSICGKPTALTLKGLVRLELYSEYELKDATIKRELDERAPELISEMEESRSASLMAFASVHGSVQWPARVVLAGLDARGFNLRVTTSSGHVVDNVLAPYPRPLSSVDDVLCLADEMHQAAFAELGVAFKLHARYYTEPGLVAWRRVVRKSPAAAPALAAASVAAVVLGALIAMRRSRA